MDKQIAWIRGMHACLQATPPLATQSKLCLDVMELLNNVSCNISAIRVLPKELLEKNKAKVLPILFSRQNLLFHGAFGTDQVFDEETLKEIGNLDHPLEVHGEHAIF